MSVDPFHMNRPVHLARRDVYFEKAVQLIESLAGQRDPVKQQKTANQALICFQEALRHGTAANQSDKTSRNTRLFQYFLETAIDNTGTIARMLERRLTLEAEDNPLDQFLGESDTGIKMSTHYQRCAAHVLKGFLLVLAQAKAPVQELQDSSLVKMTPNDQARYKKAHSHFEKEAAGLEQ